MKKLFNKEFKIGLATVICATILFWGIDYLKGINILKPDNYYYIKYKNVTGLAVSSPVMIDGFKVGLVRSINYDYSNPGNVIVEVSLDKELNVPSNSKAILVSDLLGTATINLKLNNYVSSNQIIGDTLIGENDPGLMGSLSENMIPQIEKILPRLDSIMIGLNEIINHSQLKETLINVNGMSSELKSTSERLNQIMKRDMPLIVNNLKSMSSNFNEVSSELKKIEFGKLIESVNATLENTKKITDKMNSKDNTLGLLLNDDGIYQNLNNTLMHADSLVIDLKANPKRYVHFSVFGKK